MKSRVLPENPFLWAIERLRHRGLAKTTKVVWSFTTDLFFDWRYGTDTIRRVEISSLEISSANKANADQYGATKTGPFMGLIRQLAVPRESVFVDIGSGKGKVLLVAAQCGFRKIVGIEFSPELCRLARANIALFEKKRPLHSPIEIVECDAARYRFRPDENVFFLYDPFNASVLEQVMENIRVSLEEAPRTAWLIYSAPRHYTTIDRAQVFEHCQNFSILGTDFKVYTN